MKINDNLATALTLKTSEIDKAGIGLFATATLVSGTPICEYKGDLLSEAQTSDRYKYTISNMGFSTILPEYALRHPAARASNVSEAENASVFVDCHPSLAQAEIGLGGYINDKYNNKSRIERPAPAGNEREIRKNNINFYLENGYNAIFYPAPNQPYFMVLSLRDIEEGEEIYIDYGNVFWENWDNRSTVISDAAMNTVPNSPVIVNNPKKI